MWRSFVGLWIWIEQITRCVHCLVRYFPHTIDESNNIQRSNFGLPEKLIILQKKKKLYCSDYKQCQCPTTFHKYSYLFYNTGPPPTPPVSMPVEAPFYSAILVSFMYLTFFLHIVLRTPTNPNGFVARKHEVKGERARENEWESKQKSEQTTAATTKSASDKKLITTLMFQIAKT